MAIPENPTESDREDGCCDDEADVDAEMFSYPIPSGDDAARLLGY